MCLPVLAIAGIAASLAGAGMQYLGQQKADHALNSTFNRERTRQKGFEADQVAKFQDSLNSTSGVADPAAQAAAAAARQHVLEGVTKSASPAAEGYLPGSSSAPQVVSSHAETAGHAADARTSSLAGALASLGGLNDLMQSNDIHIGRNSQEIGQIGGFKRGSLDVLQSEMDAAKQKGGTLRMLGGLAQSIGGMMLSGGLGGMGGAGGAIVPTGGATAGFGSAIGSNMGGGGFMKLLPLVH